jgi:hypothetical protein
MSEYFDHYEVVITSNNEVMSSSSYMAPFSASMKKMYHMLNNSPLRPTTILMNQDDYDDIVKWGADDNS